MKKKKVIISICLVIVLSMSALVAVQATSGDENNIFEQLKALITGNTNRIEKLENEVDTLESEIDKLKGEITELQKPTEEEKATETEKKETTTSNSNKKPTTNTTTKKTNTTTTQNTTATDYQKQVDKLNKEIEKLNTSIEELKKQDNKQTTDYQNKIDTLNTEIATLKKSIEELEKQDNKQTNEIETLKTELNNKSEELKKLINNSSSSSSSSNKNTISKSQLVGTWLSGRYALTFNNDGTCNQYYIYNDRIEKENLYTYTLKENWIYLGDTGSIYYEYINGKLNTTVNSLLFEKISNSSAYDLLEQKRQEYANKMTEEEVKRQMETFNARFTQYTGTRNGSLAKQLVNEILSNNATNTTHQISIQYNDTTVTDFDELKNNLANSNNYTISVEKDSTGYVNKIIIK